ncbi:MAG: excinuclease ABC subunit UvrC [Clostridia bacterium]
MNDLIAEKLKLLPGTSGVYKMFGASGIVIYVGKAVSLKNRVRQYFQSGEKPPKVAAMVANIEDFEYILTKNETEALTLESNLIKQFQPRYNILLKDDKQFPYVRLDIKKDFPRFEVVRRVRDDGARYFGPYLSGIALKESLDIIRNNYPVRQCKKDIEKAIARRERPCLMYHIGKCCAPCTGLVTREEYYALLDEISSFLSGNVEPVVKMLTQKMLEASDIMDYELAAGLRDRIRAIKGLSEKQTAIAASDVDRDIFALRVAEDYSLIFAVFVRNGKVVGTEDYALMAFEEPDSELIASFIKQYYIEAVFIPREILVSVVPDDRESIELWLRERSSHVTRIIKPERGEKRSLVDFAVNNANDLVIKRKELKNREFERGEGALVELSLLIGMDNIPSRIECYDISHTAGMDAVGAMIVFTDGKPDKKEYRRFKLRENENGDDYMAVNEVLTRRFNRAKSDVKFQIMPDLIIVDGGRGQLNVVLKVLSDFSISHIPAIGLAEKNEELILKDVETPITLKRSNLTLHLIERIRDEAHRFAITYHRSLRSKSALYSVLDNINGVGDKRKRALFDAFLTVTAIKVASIEDIAKVKGLTKSSAEAVYEYFHKSSD